MTTDTEFAGRVALVTGAGGGIGSAVAHALARAGAVVAALDRDAENVQATAKQLRVATGRGGALVADVSSSAGASAAVAEAEERFGPVDFLVNAAGVLRMNNAVDLTDEEWRHTFSVNTDGVFFVSREVGRRMAARRRGAIVTVASNAARVPRVHMAAYGASKAAAASFTKTLALELAGHGVRCNVVEPGSTDTPMLRLTWTDQSGAARSIGGNPDEYRVGIPLRRIADPDDIANAVLFLLSDRASQITMHELCVDGGASLGA